jgi:hypothetical protein
LAGGTFGQPDCGSSRRRRHPQRRDRQGPPPQADWSRQARELGPPRAHHATPERRAPRLDLVEPQQLGHCEHDEVAQPVGRRDPGATALKIQDEFEREAYVAPQVQELYIPEDQRLSLLQLNENTCKWPIGDPLTPDFYFCGQHSEEGKPYCDFHSRRAYHQLEKKKR